MSSCALSYLTDDRSRILSQGRFTLRLAMAYAGECGTSPFQAAVCGVTAGAGPSHAPDGLCGLFASICRFETVPRREL